MAGGMGLSRGSTELQDAHLGSCMGEIGGKLHSGIFLLLGI